MENIESKQGKINSSEETVFNFLSDLRNLDSLIPQDKVQNWESSEDTCSFSIAQVGDIHLRISQKEPNTLIKVEPEGKTPIGFSFYIQLKEISEVDTRIKLTFKAEMNTMMKMMIKSPVQKGLDQIVDTLGKLPISSLNQ
jgi:carbon monoxide dehydrogenase subunit G